MLSTDTVAVVIPCLNEAATIGALVRGVCGLGLAVYVVDDGSTDQTSDRAKSAGAVVLRNDTTQGKGASQMRGWRYAIQQGFEWVLTMDGDGQHAVADICRFLAIGDADLVVGNRMAETARMPWIRRTVNRWMSNKLSAIASMDLPDTQCGFRLMNLATFSRLTIEATHFEIESDVLLAFVAARARIRFVPVKTIYKNEQSKIHPVRDTIRWFRWLRRVRQRLSGAQGQRVCLPAQVPDDPKRVETRI